MASQNLPKLSRYIPLWKKRIPQYPLWWKGNPQLRVFLPLFWMKLRKPERNLPQKHVNFEIHPQMTQYDVKNYLEKIYKVDVVSVKTAIKLGDEFSSPRSGFVVGRDEPTKFATVLLEEHFEWPDLYEDEKTEAEKQEKSMGEYTEHQKKASQTEWHREDLPPWFR